MRMGTGIGYYHDTVCTIGVNELECKLAGGDAIRLLEERIPGAPRVDAQAARGCDAVDQGNGASTAEDPTIDHSTNTTAHPM
jgi:hypothetical protein